MIAAHGSQLFVPIWYRDKRASGILGAWGGFRRRPPGKAKAGQLPITRDTIE
jgi:hypothetical protein